VQLDEEKQAFVSRGYVDHPYPATKVQWAPEALGGGSPDLFATAGDYLRLWSVHGDHDIRAECTLNNAKSAEYCAPITSFDWNAEDPSLVATSSIDTTCTVWDVTARKIKTQLIAHDREVYDIAWSRSRNIFCTVGADGSLRLFDLRALEHSTIMYETAAPPVGGGGGAPGGGAVAGSAGDGGRAAGTAAGGAGGGPGPALLRLAWNKLDPNYLATFAADAAEVLLLDIRMPSYAIASLRGHGEAVNGVAWAPHSACHLCTVSDDAAALIWDLSSLPTPVTAPVLAYAAEGPINSVAWTDPLRDWVAVAFQDKLQILRV